MHYAVEPRESDLALERRQCRAAPPLRTLFSAQRHTHYSYHLKLGLLGS
jgi:hypothetical protein